MRSDIQAKIEDLHKSLAKMSKSWQGNLSVHLDDFMSCITELLADDDYGLTATNFVQAGVIIENSSRIYSVNVDVLWQCMNDVLEDMRTSNNKSSTEGESSENAEQVMRKRRKKVMCENFEEYVPRVIDPDMKNDERNQTIEPLPLSRCMMGKSDWKRRKRLYQVFDVEEDTLDPSEYSALYQTSAFGKLQFNMLKEMIEESSNGEHNISELIFTLERLCIELSLTVIDSCSEYSSSSRDDCSITLSVDEIIGSPARETLLVTPPPSPLTVKRSNSASIEAPSGIKRSMSDADSEKEVCGLTTKNSREHVVTITADPWVPENDMNEKNLEKRPTIALTPNIKPLKPEERKRRPSGGAKIIIQYVDVNLFYVFHKSRDSSGTIFRRFFIQGKKKRKMVLKEHSRISFSIKLNLNGIHKSLSENITEDFPGFEDFEADPGEEDGFCGFSDNADRQSTCVDSECNDNGGTSEKSCTCISNVGSERSCTCMSNVDNANSGNNEMPSSVNNDNVNNSEEEPAVPAPLGVSPCTDNEEPHCSNAIPMESPLLESEESCQRMLERVAEWERFVRPKLKQAHERGHFDIHGIGSQILESFPVSTSGAVLEFHQFLADKPRVDVARYFLATLQLANSYNIEILQSQSGDLAMDCMQMKLISSIRHHESLEDYEAPSEGARRMRKRQHAQRLSSDTDSDTGSDSEASNRSKRKCNRR